MNRIVEDILAARCEKTINSIYNCSHEIYKTIFFNSLYLIFNHSSVSYIEFCCVHILEKDRIIDFQCKNIFGTTINNKDTDNFAELLRKSIHHTVHKFGVGKKIVIRKRNMFSSLFRKKSIHDHSHYLIDVIKLS